MTLTSLPHFELIDLHPAPADMAELVRQGLAKRPRQLPAWLLYDQRGSELFSAICRQPEYGLTRTEQQLIGSSSTAIATELSAGMLVVEFGAGSAEKVSPLLDALVDPAYLAIDISAAQLTEAGQRLQASHPSVPMLGICADYSRPLQLPLPPGLASRPRLGFFPGSSLGNFEPQEAIIFLGRLRRLLGPSAKLLIGIDQPRPRALLEAAYNDAAGYSAAFALNLLDRLQRDLDGQWQADGFRYQAHWDEANQRISMALLSNGAQLLRVAGVEAQFEADEPLITEYSYKFSPQAFGDLALAAGWQCLGRWCDPADHFSLHLLQPIDPLQTAEDLQC